MKHDTARDRSTASAEAGATGATPWVGPVVAAAGVSAALYLFLFLAYPVRHLLLPVGFDPPYYVWRAQYLASQGVGTGMAASRPGYPILSALLGSVTGRSQLELATLLPLVMVPVFALAVAAFCRRALGMSRAAWVMAIGVTGVVLIPTQLVGENLSNLLNLLLVAAALILLAERLGGGRGFWAAVAMLVAGGLAHWDFLALTALVLVVAFLFALPSSARERRAGAPLLETEAGLLAGVGAVSAGIMAVLIEVVLRSPLRTVEVVQDALLYRRKLKTDLARLAVPAVAGLASVPILRRLTAAPPDAASMRRRAFALRLIGAWTLVMAAGVLAGAITSKLPGSRFLALLVALPGAVAVTAVVEFAARWVGARMDRPTAAGGGSRRRGSLARAAVVVGALILLALPAGFRWYRYPVLMKPEVLREAQTAAAYLASLPPGQPVIFPVSYSGGQPGAYATVVLERTIRIGVPADRALNVYVVPGYPGDLLAGRRTPPPDPRTGRITQPYWDAVRPVLAPRPPIVVLRAAGPAQFTAARALGASVVGPGVALLRGAPPAAPAPAAPAPDASPSVLGGLWWGAVLGLALLVAGAGWARLALGPRSDPLALAGLAAAVGAGTLVLGGLAAAEVGVRLRGWGGGVTFALIALAGTAAAVWDSRRRPAA